MAIPVLACFFFFFVRSRLQVLRKGRPRLALQFYIPRLPSYIILQYTTISTYHYTVTYHEILRYTTRPSSWL